MKIPHARCPAANKPQGIHQPLASAPALARRLGALVPLLATLVAVGWLARVRLQAQNQPTT